MAETADTFVRLEHTGTDQKDLGFYWKGEPKEVEGKPGAKPQPAAYPKGTPKERIFLGSIEDDNEEARELKAPQPQVVVPEWAWLKAVCNGAVAGWVKAGVIRVFKATTEEAAEAKAARAKAAA